MPTRTKSGMLLQLNAWLIDRFRNRELCAIVVDDAQNLTWELLEEIRLLTNLETSSEKLVQIVPVRQPELEEKLRNPCVRQLRQRISLWCKTRPLTSEETSAYLAKRLHIVGASPSVFYAGSGAPCLSLFQGIPRLINLVCEHALISAYVEQVKPVPAHIVESVSVELICPAAFVFTHGYFWLSEDSLHTASPAHQPRRRFHRFSRGQLEL